MYVSRMQDFTLKQLRYIVTAAINGSIADAAEAQAISASSIREAIAFAETKLAAPLFRRTPSRGVEPTAEGRHFVALAEQFLAAHDVFEHAALRIPHEWQTEMRIGVVATAAAMIVPPLLVDLAARVPQARFRVEEMSSEEVAARVKSGELLAGLAFNDAMTQDLAFVEIVRAPIHVGLNREHPLAGAESVTLEQLREEPYILLDFAGARAYYAGLFEQSGFKPALRYVVNSRELASELVAAGLGYSLFNMPPSRQMRKAETMRRVRLDTGYWCPSFGLFYAQQYRTLPMIRELAGAIRRLRRQGVLKGDIASFG
jgi:DNA-binding transcriptional LysR family regulator